MDDHVLSNIQLNEADEEALAQLPGLDQTLAAKIVAGQPYADIEALKDVEGMSDDVFEQIKDRLTVAEPESSDGSEPDVAEQDTPEDEPAEVTEDAVLTEPEAEVDDSVSEASDAPEVNEDGYLIMWPGEEAAETADQPVAVETADLSDEAEVSADVDSETSEESEPQHEFEPAVEPVPETEPVVAAADSPSAFRRPWLLMIVGALLGALLSLGLLFVINDGVLTIASHPKVVGLENDLAAVKQREAALNDQIDQLREELNQLATIKNQLQNSQAEIQILKQARDTLTTQITTVEDRATTLESRASVVEGRAKTLEGQVSSLEQDSKQMADTLKAVQVDTGRFNEFLDGLRALLAPPAETGAEQKAK